MYYTLSDRLRLVKDGGRLAKLHRAGRPREDKTELLRMLDFRDQTTGTYH